MDNASKAKRKVCVVDDEETIREIYRTALSRDGYEVSTAVDGEDGLKVVREQRPDIVLVDILMPKMNGVELIKRLRKDDDFSEIPIIVMTNIDEQSVVKQVGKLNTQFYLVKSLFDPKKVVAVVDEVLA